MAVPVLPEPPLELVEALAKDVDVIEESLRERGSVGLVPRLRRIDDANRPRAPCAGRFAALTARLDGGPAAKAPTACA
jgi:hypothetical protein